MKRHSRTEFSSCLGLVRFLGVKPSIRTSKAGLRKIIARKGFALGIFTFAKSLFYRFDWHMIHLSRAYLALSAFLFIGPLVSVGGECVVEVPLWPSMPPGASQELGEERDLTKETDGLVAGKRLIRLGNVSNPTLSVYRPAPEKDTGAAVLICPGGGYHILAMDLEGTEVVEWLNSRGVTGVLLKYRVPRRQGREKHEAPLEDAQRAMGIVRARAEEWGLDPKRIGVLGFSAGGHLAAALSTRHSERVYEKVDAMDDASCRPDFTVLVYPAYLTVEKEGDAVSPELVVNATTPPTFLVHAQDDGVRIESSLFYYLALKKAGVLAEMHLYPRGGHGYGLRRTELDVTGWPDLAEKWMAGMGFLKPVQQR